MTVVGYYSPANARRSLLHFFTGKAGSAVTGIAVLVLTVRLAHTTSFGNYVALIALTEIFYLLSGLGLSFFVQRYVPELRIKATPKQFRREIRRLCLWRCLLAIAFSIPLAFLLSKSSRLLGIESLSGLEGIFVLGLLFGSVMRFNDEIAQSLLLQGWLQLQTLARNLLRLGSLGIAAGIPLSVDLELLLTIEAFVAIAAAAGGFGILEAYLRSDSEDSEIAAHSPHKLPRAWEQSFRFYGAQLLAQTYSANALKLLVSGVYGVNGAAEFGFAHSVVDLLRNNSPAFLLSGWIRPLMVARYVETRSVDVVMTLSKLVIAVSIIGLLPFAYSSLVYGTELAKIVGSERYAGASVLFAPLVVIASLQAVHNVLGMVCAAVENTVAVLRATALCSITLPLAYYLTSLLGLLGTCTSIMIGELIWVCTVLFSLSQQFGRVCLVPWGTLIRASILAILFFALLSTCEAAWSLQRENVWIFASGMSALAYWLIAWRTALIGRPERQLLSGILGRITVRKAIERD